MKLLAYLLLIAAGASLGLTPLGGACLLVGAAGIATLRPGD